MSSRRSSDYFPNRLSENWWRNCTDRSVQRNVFPDRNILHSDTSGSETELSDRHWWNELSQDGSIPFKNATSLKKGSELSINISANEENSLQAINKRLVKKKRLQKDKNRFLQNLSDKSDWKQNEKNVEQKDIADKSDEGTKNDDTENEDEIEIPNKPDLFNKRTRSKMRFSKAFDSQARCANVNEIDDISRNLEIPMNESRTENTTPKKSSLTDNFEIPRKDYNLRGNRQTQNKSALMESLHLQATDSKTKKIEKTSKYGNQHSSGLHQTSLELNKEPYASNNDDSESFSHNRQLRDRKLFNQNKVKNRRFSNAFKDFVETNATINNTQADKLSKDKTTKQSAERNDHLSSISLEQNSKNVSSLHISKTGLKKPLKSGKENRHFSEGFNSENDSDNNNKLTENAVPEKLQTDDEIHHRDPEFVSNQSSEKQESKLQNKLDFSVEKSKIELGLQKKLASGKRKTRQFSHAFQNELETGENLNLQDASKKSNKLSQDYQIDNESQGGSIENIDNTSKTLISEKRLFVKGSAEKKRAFSDAFGNFLSQNMEEENIEELSHSRSKRSMTRLKNISNRKHIDNVLSENEPVTNEVEENEAQSTSKNKTNISESKADGRLSKELYDEPEKQENKLNRLKEKKQSQGLTNLSPDKNLETQEKNQSLNNLSNAEEILSKNTSVEEHTISKSIVHQKEITQQENKDPTDFSSITSIEQSEINQRRVLFNLKRKSSGTKKRNANTLQEGTSLESVHNEEKSKKLETNNETRAHDITSASSVNSQFFEKSLISSTKLYGKKSDPFKKGIKANRNSKQSTLISSRNTQYDIQEIQSKSNLAEESQKQNTPNRTRKTESSVRSASVSNKTETRKSQNDENVVLEDNEQVSNDRENQELSTNKEINTDTRHSVHKSKRLSKTPLDTNRESAAKKDKTLSQLKHLASENDNSNIPQTSNTGNNISKENSIASIHITDLRKTNTLNRNTSIATKKRIEEEKFLPNLKKYLEKRKSGKIIVKPQMKPLTTYFSVVPKKDDKFPVFNVYSSSKKKTEVKKRSKPISKGNICRPVKLYKKQKWMSSVLYKHIQKAMESQFEDKTFVESENLMKLLGESVTQIVKSRTFESTKIKRLARNLAERGVVTTMYDFYNFCEEYLPQVFCDKVVPRAQAFKKETTVPFDSAKLFENIIP